MFHAATNYLGTMKTTYDAHDCIDVCNNLLRGELSAIEAYARVIDSYSEEPQIHALVNIRHEHIESANRLRENIRWMEGVPDGDSGFWGVFSQAVQETANFFGEKSALNSLQQGEEFGRGQYESALDNDAVMPGCKDLIRIHLLPAIRRHIKTLESIQESI